MSRFKSKVVEIEAIQIDYKRPLSDYCPKWFIESNLFRISRFEAYGEGTLLVSTKNGWVKVNHGDFVIKGDAEIYPCPPDEFHKKYEAV